MLWQKRQNHLHACQRTKCRNVRVGTKATLCYRNNQATSVRLSWNALFAITDGEIRRAKARFQQIVDAQNATYDVPRIECTIYDEYYNMYEILKKDDMTSVEVAIEAYKECGITPDIQPFRGGTDGCIITYKGIPTQTFHRSGETFMGNMNS